MKKIFYVVLFTTIIVQSYSQSLSYSWAKKAGGEDTDIGNAITTDSNGNVIVVGSFISDSISFGNINLANSDSLSYSMFVAKYDSSGSLLWARNPKTPTKYKTTSGVGVATDANGNVFVAGDMNTDSINFDGNWIVFDNASYSFVAKYDSNGNFVWLRKAFGAYGTAGVSVDGNGDVLLTAKGAITFDGTIATSDGTWRHFVVKYSNSGNFIWANVAKFSSASSYGYNAEWDSKTVFTDVNNNVYMAGWSGLDTVFFNDDKTIYVANNASLRNSFLVKYNSNGVALWAKGADRSVIPNSESNINPEGIYTSDNFLYLTGWWFGDSLRFDNNQINVTSGNYNMFVAKFDMLGNNIWFKSLGSEGNDYGHGIALDSAENVYLIGTTEGYDLHYNNNLIGTGIGGNHATVFKIGTDGALLDYLQAGNIPPYGTSFGHAIAVDVGDNILFTGGFSASVSFGDDTLTSTANLNWQDIFVSKLSQTLCVNTIGTDVQTACNAYTWIDGNTYTTSNHTATFNILGGASNGCDSLVTLDLTIINSAMGVDTKTACNAFTWIDGNTYTKSNHLATFNILGGASNGCDSLVTLDLTIINSAMGVDTRTACNAYTWIDGNTYTTSNHTATFNILGGAINGCDSLVTLDLTIINSATGLDTRTACNAYTWIDGNTYTASNHTATFNIVGGAVNGCDSLVTLDLTINSVSDITISTDGVSITASNNSASFQWLNCNNNFAEIPGETNQSYIPLSNGSYAVQLTENGCIDTSACLTIIRLGIIENTLNSQIAVFPNPTNGQLIILSENEFSNAQLKVRTLDGQIVFHKNYSSVNQIDLTLKGASGVYFVEIVDRDKIALLRVIKN